MGGLAADGGKARPHAHRAQRAWSKSIEMLNRLNYPVLGEIFRHTDAPTIWNLHDETLPLTHSTGQLLEQIEGLLDVLKHLKQ